MVNSLFLWFIMIKNVQDLKSYISSDLHSSGKRLSLKSWVTNPVLRFTIVMRFLEYCVNTGKSAIFYIPLLIWFRRLSFKLGFSLGPNVFGPGVAIIHHGLLIINPATRIGKNCRIHMGVHIGGSGQFVDPSEVSKNCPHIGDNAYIGPGAKLYGPIEIGSNCTIGANAVVTKSFEGSGLLIAGVPAKILSSAEDGTRVLNGTHAPHDVQC